MMNWVYNGGEKKKRYNTDGSGQYVTQLSKYLTDNISVVISFNNIYTCTECGITQILNWRDIL